MNFIMFITKRVVTYSLICSLLLLTFPFEGFSQEKRINSDITNPPPNSEIINKSEDDLKFSVASSSSDSLTLIATNNNEFLGTAEILKYRGNQQVIFRTASGEFFKISQELNRTTKSDNSFRITFEVLNKSVSLTSSQILGKVSLSTSKQKQLNDVFKVLISNKGLSVLMKSMSILNSTEAVESHLFEESGGENCIRNITTCIAAGVTWAGSLAGLIWLCGPTLGLTCVGALLVHPAASVAVGFACSDAAKACGLGPAKKIDVVVSDQ